MQLATWPLVLMQIAAKSAKSTDADAIKSVALLLQEAIALSQVDYVAALIGERVENKLSEMCVFLKDRRIEEMEENEDMVKQHLGEWKATLQTETEELQAVSNAMGNAVIEMAEHSLKVLDQAEQQTERLREIIDKGIEVATTAPPPPPLLPIQSNPNPVSYANMAGRQIPTSHATTAARNEEKRRQFIIGTDSPDNQYPDISSLSEIEILAKLNAAFDGVKAGKSLAPEDFAILGVKKMRKGGATFDVNSDAAADWLRRGHVQADFVRCFGASSTIDSFQFKVLAEFVPVGLEIGAPGVARQIEDLNKMERGCIKDLAWIKRVERRTETQKVAHLKVSFSHPESANDAIANGLYLYGTKVTVRRLIIEPQRCSKCQRYGHMGSGIPHFVRDCKWNHDVCGRCGQMHRTSECQARMPEESKCANCNIGGHTVFDRTCPTFIEKRRKLDQIYGDQQFRFFVTQDAKTWETENMQAPEQFDAPPPPPQDRQGGTSGRWARPPLQRDQERRVQASDTRRQGMGPSRRGGTQRNKLSAANAIPLGGQPLITRWTEPTGRGSNSEETAMGTGDGPGEAGQAAEEEGPGFRDADLSAPANEIFAPGAPAGAGSWADASPAQEPVPTPAMAPRQRWRMGSEPEIVFASLVPLQRRKSVADPISTALRAALDKSQSATPDWMERSAAGNPYTQLSYPLSYPSSSEPATPPSGRR